jgi:hypothetical protein
MLTADPDTLTAHDIASGASWADRYRDSDRGGSRQRYEQTRQWHFEHRTRRPEPRPRLLWASAVARGRAGIKRPGESLPC